MKQVIKAVIFTFAVLAAVSSAMAEEHSIKVNIPFKFIAGSTPLPAGRYTISSQDNLTVEIQNSRQHGTMVHSIPIYDSESETGKIVFTMRGNRYFLTKILCQDVDLNVELPISKDEKKGSHEEKKLHGNDEVGIWLDK